MANETIDSAKRALNFSISKGSDIADFFTQNTSQDFIGWYNANCANIGAWKVKSRDTTLGNSPEVRQRFSHIWDQFPVIFNSEKINLAQFICLNSIFINEVGANLLPLTEKVGRKNHPGLAYPFDAIPGVKTSYNQAPNKTAFDLFNDDHYIAAHGHLAQAEVLKNTRDEQWKSNVYPQNKFPVSTDPLQSGFIREADFFKFRGRGFIQTTWRSNYVLLIRYIQGYSGTNPTVLRYQQQWVGRIPNEVATISTNADWDDLFQNSDLLIPCAGIRSHNIASGNYLALASDLNAIFGKGPGSIYRMGLKISGGKAYAALFQSRVIQVMLTLNQQLPQQL